jgi:hypothetical protein
LTLTRCTIDDNVAQQVFRQNLQVEVGGEGGGIYNPSGTVTVIDSTITANSANATYIQGYAGGGIYNAGDMTLRNTTVSLNGIYDNDDIVNVGKLTQTP